MPKLLIIGFVWPEPKSSAAGSRMMQLIRCFKKHNYKITFASACAKSDNAFNLENINIDQVSIKLNDSSFDDFILDLKPDIVLFDRFMTEEQFGWRVSEHCPNAIKVLDTEDLHCLRKGRQKALKDDNTFDKSYLLNDFAKREIASIYRCDITLMISEFEINLLTETFKIDRSLIAYIPFLLDEISPKEQGIIPSYNERSHFVTIGNFLHEPNFDAVLYLKQKIWPLIRKKLPNAEIHVFGAYVSQKVLQLNNNKEGFIVKGFAEDVNDIMRRYKICLAPLRFGAGLKGKLIDAMKNGTPCLMSSIAAEGMFGNLNCNGFIEDEAISFAERAVELYNSEDDWKDKQRLGYDIINKRFLKEKYELILIEKLISIKKSLKLHREQNFIGSMLQHHFMQSTKYMSKWIEEKNKS